MRSSTLTDVLLIFVFIAALTALINHHEATSIAEDIGGDVLWATNGASTLISFVVGSILKFFGAA